MGPEGGGFRSPKPSRNEAAPTLVDELATVAEVLEARNAKIEVPTGELKPEEREELNDTLEDLGVK